MGNLSEIHGPPLTGERPDLWTNFNSWVSSTPDNLAVASVHQAPGLFDIPNVPLDHDGFREKPYLRWTYRSLNDGVKRLVKTWLSLGVEEGTPMFTFMSNSAEFMLVAYASVYLGCVHIPISPRNLINTEEVMHMIRTGLSVSNGRKPVVVTDDDKLAAAVDELAVAAFADAVKIVRTPSSSSGSSSSSNGPNWVSLRSLMDQTSQPNDQASEAIDVPVGSSTKGASVLFTSGTTSLPKGIFRLHNTWALAFVGRNTVPGHLTSGSRLSCNMPNNHAMGWISLCNALSLGAAIIFSGGAFDPALILETLYRERITHTAMVPTMVHALVGVKAAKYPNRPLSDLYNITFGGAALDAGVLRTVTTELGAGGAENAYGCTEGMLITSGRDSGDFSRIVEGNIVSCGWPVPGFGVKLVDPETGEIVPRGTPGEIHGCGPTIEGTYIGGVGKENWYTDDKGLLWYKTGDQGRMDEKGRMFIVGRYKDMIIRGGENISPSAIEAALCKTPHLQALLPQIVGVPDPIAGELPVAVIKGKVTPAIRDEIQSEIVNHMGTLYVPEDIISAEDLGLSDYPRTNSGKIQKSKLAGIVRAYLAGPSTSGNNVTTNGHTTKGLANDYGKHAEGLTDEVRTIWAKAVGLEPSRIDIDAPIGEFADSITVMRVRDKIRRQTGKTLSLVAMMEAGTIEEQIKILQGMDVAPNGNNSTKVRERTTTRQGPPGVEEMAHLTEEPDLLEPTRDLVAKTLVKYGLGWEDVEDIMPVYDFGAVMCQTRLYDSWNWNFALQPSSKVDKAQLGKALEAVVINNRILASFVVWDSNVEPLHVVVRQTSQFFDLMIHDGGSVDTLGELSAMCAKHPYPDYATFPGPMYRAILYNVKETGSAAMVTSVNHAIVDASMGQIMQEDLDRALAAVTGGSTTTDAIVSQLPSHIDYKPWADSYHNLRNSTEARAATKWHVKRLASLSKHMKAGALFPPTLRTPREKYNAALIEGDDCVSVSFDVPDMHALRREHATVTAVAVVKAAVVLMNVHRTGHSHALFGELEASRMDWPFLSKSFMEQTSVGRMEATDVAGPTYQLVFNLTEVDRSKETVSEFLGRMQEEQLALSKYSAAPLKEMMRGLGDSGEDMLTKIMAAQIFNWVPGMATRGTDPHQHVRALSGIVRPHYGLCFNSGLGGRENQTVFLDIRGDGLDTEGLRRVGEEVAEITKWLTRRENWEVPVGGFEGLFR